MPPPDGFDYPAGVDGSEQLDAIRDAEAPRVCLQTDNVFGASGSKET